MPDDDRVALLSRQQRACLELVGEGFRSKEIGRRLGISPSTVDNHIYQATVTLGIKDRAEAARRLRQSVGTGQQSPRQPQPLGNPPIPPHPDLTTGGSAAGRWWQRILPPIGGRANDLAGDQRVFAMLRIAFLASLVLMACVIVITGTFAILG